VTSFAYNGVRRATMAIISSRNSSGGAIVSLIAVVRIMTKTVGLKRESAEFNKYTMLGTISLGSHRLSTDGTNSKKILLTRNVFYEIKWINKKHIYGFLNGR
jgi:hypothetical protein